MSHINDLVLQALGPGNYNDFLLVFYHNGGATSNNINDAEYEYLLAKGAPPMHRNDMWALYLEFLGYEGSLNDMMIDFWKGGPPTEDLLLWSKSKTTEISESLPDGMGQEDLLIWTTSEAYEDGL